MNDIISHLHIDGLHESPFNPRQIFDDGALHELSVNIRTEGRVLSPLLVRPRIPPLFAGDPEAIAGYEIVFGHRRYRAAVLAGLTEVPCMVRAMTDDEARRAQISENLLRKDVHPIEEAEGFQALIDSGTHSADMIAAEFGKSRSYVYGRLKLLDACPTIRQACLSGEVGSEVALLIARLRSVKLQTKALEYIHKDYHAKLDDGGKSSFRAIREMLAEKFTLDLGKALFDIEAEMLLPVAGNCVTCPKRTENAPEYADLVQDIPNRYGTLRKGNADACTDPDCFEAKTKAHLKCEAGKLAAAGHVVVEGNAARNAISATGEIKGAYVALKDAKASLKALPKTAAPAPKVIVIQDPRTGKMHDVVKREDLKAAGVPVKEVPQARNDSTNYRQQAEEREKQIAAAAVETLFRLALRDEVRAAAAQVERSTFDLRLIAQTTLRGVQHRDLIALGAIYGVDSHDDFEARINQMGAAEIALFLIDCAVSERIHVNYYDLKQRPEALLTAAAHYGVDLELVRAKASGTGPTPASAARAPGRAKAAQAPEGPDEQEQEPGPEHEQKDDAGVAVDLPAPTRALEHSGV